MKHGQRSGRGRIASSRLFSREWRWTLAMFLCGAAVSSFCYFVSPAPDARQGSSVSPGEFVPSLFLAAGWGFVVPLDYDAPELAPFLRRQVSHFDPGTIPPDLEVTTPHSWDQRHRYLYYAGALIWMLFGISWPVMKLLPILLYASMWPLLFRIFRLAGGRRLAAACTALFMLQPAVIDLHWTMRDFSKAPFFLGVILVIGLLLQRQMGARRLVTLAVLAGIIAGIGVGFRRDLVMAVLPALVAIGVAPRLVTRFPWRTKALAAAGLLLAFYIAGAPIHAAYSGAGDPHDAVMGFSRRVDGGMGVHQADYQHLPLQSDYQIHATMLSAARRADGQFEANIYLPGDVGETGMKLVRWLVLTYPADVVTRALASVRWALSGGLAANRTAGWLIILTGIVLPALTLFTVASGNMRRGFALLLVGAPLFGYIALQFGWRHGFHLTFAPLWCMLFLHTQWRLYRRYRACRLRNPASAGLPPTFLRPGGAVRGLAVLAAALVLLLTPLMAARAIQKGNVHALIARYQAAERTPVPTAPRPIGDHWTLFATDPDAPEPDVPYNTVDWPFREAYLVAVFAPGAADTAGVMKYETDDYALDFSFSFWLPATPESGEPIHYYFPVFENWHKDAGAWNRFSGVVLPNDAAGRFLGLYRLDRPEEFPFWSLYRIQGDGDDFEYARRLSFLRAEPEERIDPHKRIPTWLNTVDRSMGQFSGLDPVEHALPAVRDALEADPLDASLWIWLGNIHEHAGEYGEALAAYMRAVEIVPRHFAAYMYLERMAPELWTDEEQIVFWQELSARHESAEHPRLALERALAQGGPARDGV